MALGNTTNHPKGVTLNLTPEQRKKRSENRKKYLREHPRTTPTFKQKIFAKKYVENGGNGTKAALAIYDATYNDASTIASGNLKKPAVINEIDKLLKEINLDTDSWIAKKLKQAVDNGMGQKATTKDALNAISMILKVNNSLGTNKSVKMNISLHGELTDKNVSEIIGTVQELSTKSTDLIADLKAK